MLSRFLIGQKTKTPAWYKRYSCYVPGTPPGWVFGVIWTVLYVLLTTSVYFFYSTAFDDIGAGVYIDAYTLLLMFNIVCNQTWSMVFFDMASPIVGFMLILGIISTGIGLIVIMAIKEFFLELGLFVPYIVWSLYALYLNGYWIYIFQTTNVKNDIMDLRNARNERNASFACNDDYDKSCRMPKYNSHYKCNVV